ncbi:glycoside hydrolase family 32 protein [Novipirellula artificiosorum]|uniref:Levanase n=1 Tax=Novipirellula artificiosorum TaxID=2528016 RepID=A0A5C6DWF2_9BACT|nr:glycoside hydrolase family 32 protein [Novipirellula artificiosorum]TWU40564.1 Levanase precursor [Novipirellula artificiosorum]
MILVLLLVLLAAVPVVAQDVIIADFEGDSYSGWAIEGSAFGTRPARGESLGFLGYRGGGVANSFATSDEDVGSLTSAEFQIAQRYIVMLVGGGKQANGQRENQAAVELLVDGRAIRTATGDNSETLRWHSWDVAGLKGQSAQIRIFDNASGEWGHICVDHILQSESPRAGTGVWRIEEYRSSADYFQEPFRPGFHFTPELNWMNDPNGLTYFGGEYHLFYQHNPLGNVWGHMSWGHAVSKDMFHWEHLPIAMYEENGVMVYSGSCIIDHNNTSGFGTGDEPPMIAIYTGHSDERETQDIAYSNDRGRTWTKYGENPVIDLGKKDFRDPKVFWHPPSQKWCMVVSLAREKRLQFYASPDLKNWSLLSEFGPAGVRSKSNWECPDLFELPIENEPGHTRWVLEADMGNGAVAGGSGGEYFTGMFDGQTFRADSTDSKWVDYGRDFYAPVTYSNLPRDDGRRVWVGWMNNWSTALNPTYPWRSAMSVPRELSLRRIGDQLRLCQRPVASIESLRKEPMLISNMEIEDGDTTLSARGQQLDLMLVIDPGTARRFGVRVLKGDHEQTEIGYDMATESLSVDRTQSGNVKFHQDFSGKHAGPLGLDPNGQVRLRLLVDRCSVEVFGGEGETVLTDLIFPSASSDRIELFAEGGRATVVDGQVFQLDASMGPNANP